MRSEPNALCRSEVSGRLEELYRVFGGYEGTGAVPLEIRIAHPCDLGTDHLQVFLYAAMRTLGSTQDVKRLLPRMLELSVGEPFALDVETIARTLRLAGWQDWPAHEREAVLRFFAEYWCVALAGEADVPSILCAVANLECELAAYLSIWRNERRPTAYVALARLIIDCGGMLEPPRIPSQMWEGRAEQWRQVVTWLAEAATLAYFEAGYFATESPVVSDACEVLRAIFH
jgi:hypothetical protein